MKHTKTAAAVAGSVMALGTATPAVAADAGAPMDQGFSSLNGGLYKALSSDTLDVAPIEGPIARDLADTLNTRQLTSAEGPLGALKELPLLGGLPLSGGLPLR